MASWPAFDFPLSRHPQRLAEAFAAISRHLTASASTKDALTSIVELTPQIVPGARWVSITRGRGDRWTTEVWSDRVARDIDLVQYKLGHGPCLDAVTDQSVFRSRDLSVDERWDGFGSTAAHTYGGVRDAFDDDSLLVGTLLAAHAAIALTAVINREARTSLTTALESARLIGMAMGIIMSSMKVTEAQAFDLLRIASQSSNTKIRDLAYTVTQTGLLELPPRHLPT